MSYACPHCGAISHNPNDEINRYCARCDRFENETNIHDYLARTGAKPAPVDPVNLADAWANIRVFNSVEEAAQFIIEEDKKHD